MQLLYLAIYHARICICIYMYIHLNCVFILQYYIYVRNYTLHLHEIKMLNMFWRNAFSNSRLLVVNYTNRLFNAPDAVFRDTVHTQVPAVPAKPRKPTSSFIRFVLDSRGKILQENPHLKPVDVVKRCAVEWKTVPSTQKLNYENAFKRETELYRRAIIDYQSSLTDEQKAAIADAEHIKKSNKQSRLIRRMQRENNKPKKPPSSYGLFAQEEKRISGRDMKDIMKEGLWRRMSPNEKQKYVDAADQLKSAYENDIEKWESQMVSEGKENLVRHKTLSKLRKAKPSQRNNT